MGLSDPQRGTLRGMALGGAATVVLIACGALLNPFGYAHPLPVVHRVAIASGAWVLIALTLAFAIARLARHRFFSAEDIDGGGRSPGTPRAAELQAVLQNTVEQSVLAALVYGAWAIRMPASTLSVVPLAAGAFLVGRVLFFAGYARGAPGRALGFALGFYPSVGMIACLIAVECVGWFQ